METISYKSVRIVAAFLFVVAFCGNLSHLEVPFEAGCSLIGDQVASLETLITGRNFDRVGFAKLSYVTSFQRLLDGTEAPGQIEYYTHYPPFPGIFHGWLFRAGLDSEQAHRVVALLCTYLSAALALVAFCRLFPPGPALLGWACSMFSPLFFYFADSLHQFSFLNLIYWTYLLYLLHLGRLLSSGAPVSKARYFWASFAFGVLVSWVSLDGVVPILLLTLLLFAYAPPSGGRAAWRPFLVAPFLGELVGTLLHVIHNAPVVGGLSAAFRDFFVIGKLRSGLNGDYGVQLHIGRSLLTLEWFYTLPLLGTAAAGWYLAFRRKGENEKRWLGIATFAGAVLWHLVMRNHSVIHSHPYTSFAGFTFLGVAAFASLAKSVRGRLWVACSVAFALCHHVAVLTDFDFLPLKETVIQKLVPPNRLPVWAAVQSKRGKECRPRRGARALVSKWLTKQLPLDSKSAEDTLLEYDVRKPLGEKVAELVLYFR